MFRDIYNLKIENVLDEQSVLQTIMQEKIQYSYIALGYKLKIVKNMKSNAKYNSFYCIKLLPNDSIFIIFFKIMLKLKIQIKFLNSSDILEITSRL